MTQPLVESSAPVTASPEAVVETAAEAIVADEPVLAETVTEIPPVPAEEQPLVAVE